MLPADTDLAAEDALPLVAHRLMEAVDNVTGAGQAGEKLSRAIHALVLKGGDSTRNLVDVLHGTWLGHPLHVVLTDLTIGAWAAGGALDAVGAVTNSQNAKYAGDRLAEMGAALAIPTALAGMADYSTVPKKAAASATYHGLMNSAVLGLYLLSIRDRRHGRRGRGVLFSSLAQGLTLASAWIGGELVYKHRVGVSHKEQFTGPQDWTPVLAENELQEQTPKRVEFEGQGVLLFKEGQTIQAIGATCSHAGGPLEEGRFHEGCVRCPWHDSEFDLRNGHIVHGPATQPQASFEARMRDGQVEIRLVRP